MIPVAEVVKAERASLFDDRLQIINLLLNRTATPAKRGFYVRKITMRQVGPGRFQNLLLLDASAHGMGADGQIVSFLNVARSRKQVLLRRCDRQPSGRYFNYPRTNLRALNAFLNIVEHAAFKIGNRHGLLLIFEQVRTSAADHVDARRL